MRILLSAAALATVAAASGAAASEPPVAAAFAPGPARAKVVAACAACHATTIITGKHYPAEKWGTVVDLMIDRGARVSDSDYDAIVAYLGANYGPAHR